MREEPTAVDITAMPEVVSLAEEVRASGRARLLRCAGRDVAMVVPVPSKARSPRRARTAADLAAAGSWADVDTDDLIDQVSTSRRSSRPSVEL